jgi:hypothetical protein
MIVGNGDDGTVIDIELCSAVHPALGQAQEGGGVESRKDGQEWGTLGGAAVDVMEGAREAIDADGCSSIGEERVDPIAEEGGKAIESKEVDKTGTADVVKEALNVEEED